MPKIAIAASALALLMTSAALAQTSPEPAPDETPPAPIQPVEPGTGVPPDLQPEAAPGEEGAASPDPTEDAESAEAIDEDDAARMRDRDGSEGRDRRGRRDRAERARDGEHLGGGHREMHERHMRAMRGMGWGRGVRRGPEGATFRFNRGEEGPSIVIKCADRDTTQECVDAVMPMLEMVLPDRR